MGVTWNEPSRAWMQNAYHDEHYIKDAKKAFENTEPFKHLQVPDFLEEDALEELSDALSEQEFSYKESDLFSLAQTPDLQSVEDEVIQDFVDFMNSDELRAWFEEITEIDTTRGGLDIFGAVYQDTDYLLAHDDRLEDRKIAWILYLETLGQEQGGALALFSDEAGTPGEKVRRYQPKKNTLVFFEVSEKSWHEVEEVTGEQPRVSIGGWLKC